MSDRPRPKYRKEIKRDEATGKHGSVIIKTYSDMPRSMKAAINEIIDGDRHHYMRLALDPRLSVSFRENANGEGVWQFRGDHGRIISASEAEERLTDVIDKRERHGWKG